MCSMGAAGRLNRTGMEACRTGRLDEAEASLLAALRLVQTRGSNCTAAKIHNNLGIVYELQGRREKALHHYSDALELMKAKGAVSHPLHLRITRGLARVALIDSTSG
jgi:tetratricopeptide (TPR) repeat protein